MGIGRRQLVPFRRKGGDICRVMGYAMNPTGGNG